MRFSYIITILLLSRELWKIHERIGLFVCELSCRWLVTVGQLVCRRFFFFFLWVNFCLWVVCRSVVCWWVVVLPSDQPRHPPSLIRVFTVCMKKAWVLSYPFSAQRRLWSDSADAQADLSLRWAHSHFVGFVMLQLICKQQWCRSAFASTQFDQRLCYWLPKYYKI